MRTPPTRCHGAFGIGPCPGFFFHAILQTQENYLIAGGCFAASLVAYPATDSIGGKSGERARSANKQQEGALDSRTNIHRTSPYGSLLQQTLIDRPASNLKSTEAP
jgi:hypothetical protein